MVSELPIAMKCTLGVDFPVGSGNDSNGLVPFYTGVLTVELSARLIVLIMRFSGD